MQQALREDNVVTLLCGSRYFRATRGVADPTGPPTLPQFSTTVVARKTQPPLEQSTAEIGEEEKGDDEIDSEEQWIFGAEAESLASQCEDTVLRPIQTGRIVDWTRFAALCDHILFTQLGCRRVTNNSPIVMGVPEDWNKRERERVTQILFEQLNTPAMMMVDQPLLTAYGVGTTTGVVIDIGYETIVITPVIDGFVQRHANQRMEMGTADLDLYLLKLLQAPGQVEPNIDPSLLESLAQYLRQSNNCNVLHTSTDKHEKQQVEYQNNKITIHSAHQVFAEPLFDPHLIGKDLPSLAKALSTAVMACEVDKRSALCEYVILTGGGAHLNGLRERLEFELSKLFPASENGGEAQMSSIRFVGVPDYLGEYREHPELFGILGASILSKVALSDSKNFITKADYNQRGPSVIHAKNP
ncbi:actin family [Syncephalis fuscata]|nr:actin family [Syncephalis fuscata]